MPNKYLFQYEEYAVMVEPHAMKYVVLNTNTDVYEHECAYLYEAVHMCKWLKLQLVDVSRTDYLTKKMWEQPRQLELNFNTDKTKN